MKYQKFTRQEKKEINSQILANALHGEGLYLYENNTKADIKLPKPTKSGVKSIGPKQRFQGDNYYMQLVRSGLLRLIKELQSPEQERQTNQSELLNEATNMNEQKLILDQPDKVTNKGVVEHVLDKNTPKQKLNETKKNEPQPDVLLNEGPVDDGFVIVG